MSPAPCEGSSLSAPTSSVLLAIFPKDARRVSEMDSTSVIFVQNQFQILPALSSIPTLNWESR